jgi:hypothetical protein
MQFRHRRKSGGDARSALESECVLIGWKGTQESWMFKEVSHPLSKSEQRQDQIMATTLLPLKTAAIEKTVPINMRVDFRKRSDQLHPGCCL